MPLNKRKRRVTGRTTKTEYPRLTLAQALDTVLADKRAEGLRDRTLRDYEKMWGYFVKWLNDNYEIETVDEITTEMIRNYINWMKYDKRRYSGHKFINSENQRVGLSDTTININLRCLRSIFNHLEREELIEVNPMARIKQLRQDIDLGNPLTDEEIREILRMPDQRDYVGFRDYVAMNLLLDTGMRAQELLNLRVQDIDFKSRLITLSAEVNKNRRSRFVPFSSYVAKLLMQLISENRMHFTTDRIFLSSYGEPLGANHFNKRLKYYAELAGFDTTKKRYTAHAYRHTWAKNMILNGMDPFTLQKMGGWADIRTMRRYIQIDENDLRMRHDNYSPVMNLRKRKR